MSTSVLLSIFPDRTQLKLNSETVNIPAAEYPSLSKEYEYLWDGQRWTQVSLATAHLWRVYRERRGLNRSQDSERWSEKGARHADRKQKQRLPFGLLHLNGSAFRWWKLKSRTRLMRSRRKQWFSHLVIITIIIAKCLKTYQESIKVLWCFSKLPVSLRTKYTNLKSNSLSAQLSYLNALVVSV